MLFCLRHADYGRTLSSADYLYFRKCFIKNPFTRALIDIDLTQPLPKYSKVIKKEEENKKLLANGIENATSRLNNMCYSASKEGDTTAKFKKGTKSTESLAKVEESTQIGTTGYCVIYTLCVMFRFCLNRRGKNNKIQGKKSTESLTGVKESTQIGITGSSLTMPDPKQWFEAFFEGDMTEIQYLPGEVLHIAAIVGNSYAAELLLKKNINLLHIKDNFGKKPLLKAYENVRLQTAYLLLKATNGEKIRIKNAPTDHQNNPLKSNHVADGGKNAPTVHQNSPLKSNISDEDFSTGIGVLVQAISAKQYDIAERIINQEPEYAVSNDEVLMTLARTFLSELHNLEAFLCPRKFLYFSIFTSFNKPIDSSLLISGRVNLLYLAVPHIKEIELKKKEYEDAKKVLQLVCQKIKDKHPADSSSRRELYTKPFLEAARQDAYDVVDEILEKWPEAITCKDEKGHNIIQLATMHRSLKIYNLIYTFREHSN
ncbi:hypothetical protein R6Q59_023180 [Mikania micrantha]